MQIKCVAMDDEPLALELLKQYIAQFPTLKLVQIFDDAISGAQFLKAHPIDLLFIDINMPDLTGIDLVRSLNEKPITIFTTAYRKFAIDGFELNALDYLLKPIEFERFSKAVHKAIDHYKYKMLLKNEQPEFLFVRSEYKLVKIELNDIEYIESLEDYLKIYLSTSKFIMTLMTVKAMLEKLPPDKFKRIHRSYIVPLAKIKSFSNKKVLLTSIELPVSDTYATFIHDWIKK